MAPRTERRQHRLVITFGEKRSSVGGWRSALLFIAAIGVFHLGFAFVSGAELPFWSGWSTADTVFTTIVIAVFAWAILRDSTAKLEIDERLGEATLERRYLHKTRKQRFKFDEIERFEAEVADASESEAVQPRLVLRNGETVDLGPQEVAQVAVAKAAIARAQKALGRAG